MESAKKPPIAMPPIWAAVITRLNREKNLPHKVSGTVSCASVGDHHKDFEHAKKRPINANTYTFGAEEKPTIIIAARRQAIHKSKWP